MSYINHASSFRSLNEHYIANLGCSTLMCLKYLMHIILSQHLNSELYLELSDINAVTQVYSKLCSRQRLAPKKITVIATKLIKITNISTNY
jgi:uncharacterized protein YfkK (UPF0435 family)